MQKTIRVMQRLTAYQPHKRSLLRGSLRAAPIACDGFTAQAVAGRVYLPPQSVVAVPGAARRKNRGFSLTPL